MTRFLSCCLALLLCAPGFAQQVNINWGEESKSELSFGSFVNGSGDNTVKLSFDVKGGFFSQKTLTPILTTYSNKLTEGSVRKFEVSEKNISFNTLLSVKGKLFLFTNQYDRDNKSTTFFCQPVNIQTLQPEGENINLGAFDAINKSSQSTVGYELSKDSSKILMFGLSPYSKKDNEKYYIGVYDNNMQKLWDNTVELPYKDKYIVVLDQLVTNEGKVGVIIKHYDQEVSREMVRENGEKVPSYKTKLLLYDNKQAKPKEFLLATGNKFIHTLQLTADQTNNLVLFGLYKEKYNGYISGYVVANVNKATGAVTTTTMNDFPAALVGQVKIDRQGSTRESDPGLSDKFKLATIVDREDGSKDYLVEYSSARLITRSYMVNGSWTYSSYWQYDYGDIIDICVKPNGSQVITRIPKMQSSQDVRHFSNFKALPYQDKLLLFYNDDEDNIDRDLAKKPDEVLKFSKSAFVMAVVDAKGTLTRKAVFSHRDMRLITAVRECTTLDKNRIGLYALREGKLFAASKDMVGILEVH